MSNNPTGRDRGSFEDAPLLAHAGADDPRLGVFLADLEDSLAELPPQPVVTRHLSAMLAAAGTASLGERKLSRRRIGVVLLAASVAMSVMLVGFSYAGFFTFPEPVRDALSWFGLDTPAPQQDQKKAPEVESADPSNPDIRPSGPQNGGGPPATRPGRGDRPDPQRGDQPGVPGGAGDQPDGRGDRPDKTSSPCPFPYDILGCTEDDGP